MALNIYTKREEKSQINKILNLGTSKRREKIKPNQKYS